MRYRNINTGAEFFSRSKISAPDWVEVGAETPKKAAEDPVKAEPAEVEPVKEDPKPVKKTATKKPAPKKKGAKK